MFYIGVVLKRRQSGPTGDAHDRLAGRAACSLAEVGNVHPVPVQVFVGTLDQVMGAANAPEFWA